MPASRTLRCALAALCGLLLLGWGEPVRAQDGTVVWQPLKGPGGRISLLASGLNASDLFAVSVAAVNRKDDQTQWDSSGTPRRSDALYLSRDGGASWQPASDNLIPGTVTSLYVDPATGAIFVGLLPAGDVMTQQGGLWQSTDAGARWQQVPLGRGKLKVLTIVRNADGRFLFLGVTDNGSLPESLVYRSADGGKTWTAFRALGWDKQPGSTLFDLTPHPSRPHRLFITTLEGDVYLSDDAGETWSLSGAHANEPTAPRDSGPAYLAVNAQKPDYLLAARGRSADGAGSLTVERSLDGGTTWSELATSGLPAESAVNALAALPDAVFLLSTDGGTYRSSDGGLTWQLLEGSLSSGDVTGFLAPAGSRPTALAATGNGIFISREGGALWQRQGSGLPANGRIVGLLTDARQPGSVFAITGQDSLGYTVAPPAVLHSTDGGRTWNPAAHGLWGARPTAWASDPADANSLFISSHDAFYHSADAGLTWQATPLTPGEHRALVVAPSDPNILYLGGNQALRSLDRGATWQPMPVMLAGQEGQAQDVTGLAVDPLDVTHVWAAMASGVLESRDGGGSWQAAGLDGRPVSWLVSSPAVWAVDAAAGGAIRNAVYAGVAGDGIYRWDGGSSTWSPTSGGLPLQSTILSLVADPASPGTLWASRDGGGIYRTGDFGANWTNVAVGVGDNLGLALAIDFRTPGSVLLGTATAGVWAGRPGANTAKATTSPSTSTTRSIDARIEVVWPHDFAPVAEAKEANIGLRLFEPNSLIPPSCGWNPNVIVWQAVGHDPAEPLGQAEQRSVDGRPFPYWVLNDVDVTQANDPNAKLSFIVRVGNADTATPQSGTPPRTAEGQAGPSGATSVWVHGIDPRTYFPFPDVPSGVAVGDIPTVDTRIEIVWPHDEAGNERPVTEATLANVAVSIFQHGTRVSVSPDWQPAGVTLYGAWNNEVGRALSRAGSRQVRKTGAITYPVWEFNNIPVAQAIDSANKLHLWVMVDGVETHPNIWTHGSDARTAFPAQDEPIQGCVP